MALGQRAPASDLIHHTDRGSQYTADDYLALLKAQGVTVSMSGKGDPYDNAMMESFFSTLRAECTELHHFATRATARLVIFEYVMVLYNRQRLHSALGYQRPVDFEADYSP
jgi:transposase InsO family protein